MDYEAEAQKLWDKLFLEHRNSDYPVHIEIIATALREAYERGREDTVDDYRVEIDSFER